MEEADIIELSEDHFTEVDLEAVDLEAEEVSEVEDLVEAVSEALEVEVPEAEALEEVGN